MQSRQIQRGQTVPSFSPIRNDNENAEWSKLNL